jgi:hypothetical protein
MAGGRQPVREEGLRGDEYVDVEFLMHPRLKSFRVLTGGKGVA